VGSLPFGTRVRVFLQSGKSAAHHARGQFHPVDCVEPYASAQDAKWSNKREGCGSRFDYFDVVACVPAAAARRRWAARITEFEWDRYFADVQDEGPFKSWHHRHEFASAWKSGTEGTTIRDVIDYDVGFGLAGTFANAYFVRRQMKSTFVQRQQTLPQLLASAQ